MEDEDEDDAVNASKGKTEKFFVFGPNYFANVNLFFFNHLAFLLLIIVLRLLIVFFA